MSYKKIECGLIVCDECDEPYENGEYTPHYGPGEHLDPWAAEEGGWQMVALPNQATRHYCQEHRLPTNFCMHRHCMFDVIKVDGTWLHIDSMLAECRAAHQPPTWAQVEDDEETAPPLPPPAGQQQELPA